MIDSSARIPALDGLRGWAILLVLLCHSILQTTVNSHPVLRWMLRLGQISWSGVDLFFVLSGFLIGGILLDARESPHYFKTFYLRRAFRILPLYFLLVLLCWIAFSAGATGLAPPGWARIFHGPVPWAAYLTFTQNIYAALRDRLGGGGLALTWSLAVEEQFYLTLPLIIRFAQRKHLLSIVIGIIVGSGLLRILLIYVYPTNAPMACHVLMPCRADALGLGVLSAILVRDGRAWDYMVAYRRMLYALAGMLLFAVLLIALRFDPVFSASLFGLQYLVLALFYNSLLLIAVTGTDRFVRFAFCNRPLMKLGGIAYGTYLFHQISLDGFHAALLSSGVTVNATHSFGTMAVALSASLALAAISWRFFEKPLVRRGHRFTY